MRRRVLYVMSGLVLVSCVLLDRAAEAQVNAGNGSLTAATGGPVRWLTNRRSGIVVYLRQRIMFLSQGGER